jgi:hypothetical protein
MEAMVVTWLGLNAGVFYPSPSRAGESHMDLRWVLRSLANWILKTSPDHREVSDEGFHTNGLKD